MSKKNNVNPDHYKTAGRERPGQDVVQEIQKQNFAEAKASEEVAERGTGSKFIPGNAQTSVTPSKADTDAGTARGDDDQDGKN